VKLLALAPPIDRMDPVLNTLTNVRHLSLSTNAIDKMIPLPGLKNLEILSLGRNMVKKEKIDFSFFFKIKKIQGLEEVGATLKELWLR
jgi:dynein light chain 1, axonemal